jgi:hypothetical protein
VLYVIRSLFINYVIDEAKETLVNYGRYYRRAVPWTLYLSDLVCLFRDRRSVRLEFGFSRYNKGRSLVIIHIIVIIS